MANEEMPKVTTVVFLKDLLITCPIFLKKQITDFHDERERNGLHHFSTLYRR